MGKSRVEHQVFRGLENGLADYFVAAEIRFALTRIHVLIGSFVCLCCFVQLLSLRFRLFVHYYDYYFFFNMEELIQEDGRVDSFLLREDRWLCIIIINIIIILIIIIIE